jgi:serine/threonine protein kinase
MTSSTMARQGTAGGDPGRDDDCFAQEGLPRRFGRYHLLKLLARGGMGQVFLASTTGVEGAERPVVVKVIRREHAKDPNFLARFLDEARVQSQLQHSGVAQVLEADTHEPTADPFVVIEYVEGRSLGNLRQRAAEVGMRLRWEDAVAIGTQIMDALAHIHERRDPSGSPLGIVHRDLSPHNVMLGYSGEIKIIDFGTARGQNRRCRTVAGVVFAKPGYVAPEVANGDSGDARVDLYAAGVMIWELCAGRRFLQGDPADHLAAVARNERNLPPIAALVGAPSELDLVIAKLTVFDRAERYPSSRAAAAQLAALLSASPALPNGERGVRARVAQLMYGFYPMEPGKSRRRFAKLVAAARECQQAWEPGGSLEPVRASEAPPTEHDPLGFLVGTRYGVRHELGRGASSVVYEAEHLELGRRVAIKVLDAEHTHSRDFAARFRKEARALSRLAHPGLVRVHDFGQSADGKLFCVMELLEGQSLRMRLDRGEVVGWKEALRIARRCCLALQAAHDMGVVHRDIKPGNIFLTADDRVKLIDFSLAKTAEEVGELAADDAAELGTATAGSDRAGAMTLFGTPDYMAPEQIAGGQVDARADIYALGSVLYEMVTGRLPFVAEGMMGGLDAKLRGNPEDPRERVPSLELPRGASRLIMKALARHPSRRFQSAADMADAIAEVLDAPSRVRQGRRAVGYSLLAAVMAFAVVLLGKQLAPWLQQLPGDLGGADAAAGEPPAASAVPAVPSPEPRAAEAAATHVPPPASTEAARPSEPRPGRRAPAIERSTPASTASAPAAAPPHPLPADDALDGIEDETEPTDDGAIRVDHRPGGTSARTSPVVLAAPAEDPEEP